MKMEKTWGKTWGWGFLEKLVLFVIDGGLLIKESQIPSSIKSIYVFAKLLSNSIIKEMYGCVFINTLRWDINHTTKQDKLQKVLLWSNNFEMVTIPTSKKLPPSNNKLILTLGFLMCVMVHTHIHMYKKCKNKLT